MEKFDVGKFNLRIGLGIAMIVVLAILAVVAYVLPLMNLSTTIVDVVRIVVLVLAIGLPIGFVIMCVFNLDIKFKNRRA